MIVSHKHRFIFVKTRKTAGTSVEVLLSSHCGEDDIVTPINPHEPPHVARNHDGCYNHMPASAIRERIGEDAWRSYFKFTIERNPWEKTLSYFHMMRQVREQPDKTLSEFLKEGDLPVDHRAYTEDGRLLVDRVLEYDRLDNELGDVLGNLGLPYAGSIGIFAKSSYRTDRRPYEDVYSPADAEIVSRAFAVEIGLFGYVF